MTTRVSRQELIADLQKFAQDHPEEVTRNLYKQASKYGQAYKSRFHTWERFCVEAGVTEGEREPAKSLDRDLVVQLKKNIQRLERDLLREGAIAEQVLKISKSAFVPPEWMLQPVVADHTPGVPTLLVSDVHYGEVTKSDSIMGYNAYNMSIAAQRLKRMTQVTLDLCYRHMVKPDYPGIVIPLAGDMISGDIHEELLKTNEMPTIPALVELYHQMISLIDEMKRAFGNVFLPCVTGNHGRTTKKMQSKQRVETSYDYLLYVLLQKWFELDPHVKFLIPRSQDAMYRIHNHIYLLRHGDCYRGGDGMIGMLGPVTRGDHKTRSRNSMMGHPYDTQILGHFHRLSISDDFVINGSVCGYNEYAFNNNFKPEIPQQALWFTHHKLGMTFRLPVFLDRLSSDEESAAPSAWVSVF
jgi:hypothetical protein